MVEMRLDAEVEDVTALLVEHALGQTKFRDLRAHHAAGLGSAVENAHLIAGQRQVAGHGQRRGAGADTGDALAVLGRRRLRQPLGEIVLEVGRNALQAADGDRFLVNAAAPAGRLAGTVAHAPENSREHVRPPVDHVGVRITARSDQADVFGHGRMGWTRPLAIHDFMEVVGMADIRRLHVSQTSCC